MARIVSTLPSGTRITDYISLGVITKTFPTKSIHGALKEAERTSLRNRDLPGACSSLLCVKCQYIGYPILRVNNANTSVTHAPEVIYFKH